MSRRRRLLLALLASASALAGPARADMQRVAQKPVGPWTLSAWNDAAGLFSHCSVTRRAGELGFGFTRGRNGYRLVLSSPGWTLEPKAAYAIRLRAGDKGREVTARATGERALVAPLGTGPEAVTPLAAATVLEVQAAGGTLRTPLDGAAEAFAELDACWTERSAVAANPFARRPAMPAADTPAPVPAATPAAAGPGALSEEPVFLEVEISGLPYRLEALVVKPARPAGRLPVALITHGSTSDPEQQRRERAAALLPQARDMARRGWLAVVVVRRGYGRSEGQSLDPANCRRPDYRRKFDADADDLEAALRAIARRDDADAERVVAMGGSGGGAATLALAARHPEGLRAVVNVSGGLQLIRGDGLHCGSDLKLSATMAGYGSRTRIPSLWIYAENDGLFRPELVRTMHRAYRGAGAPAELRLLQPVGHNGHNIFWTPEGRLQWLTPLDAFLRAEGLPTWDSRLAEEVLRLGRFERKALAAVEQYLSAPGEKAFAIRRTGTGGSYVLRASLDAARKAALEKCERDYKGPCDLLLENNEIVRDPEVTASTAASSSPQ